MSVRRTALLAWGWCALILALILGAVVLALLNRYSLGTMSFLFAEVSAALVGALISWREPRNPIGWFILGHAFCFSLGEFGCQYATYGVLTEPGSLPFARAAIWPTYWIWNLGLLLMVALLPLYFPNGRLLLPRWRWAVRAVALFAVIAIGITMFLPGDGEAAGIPNPLGIEGLFEEPGFFSAALAVVLLASWPVVGATSAVSLVLRFRRAAGEERQQIKWVVYAVVFMVTYFALSQLFLRDLIPLAVDDLLLPVSLEGL